MKNLKNHPYANCGVIETEKQVVFVSYITPVLIIDKEAKTMECTGLYSPTTSRQIGWFLSEYYPEISYFDVKEAVEHGYDINLESVRTSGLTGNYKITGTLVNGNRFKPIHTSTPWNYNIYRGSVWAERLDGSYKKVKTIWN